MIKALFGNIIVSPESVGETRKGSIIVPDLGKDLAIKGTVVSTGHEVEVLQVGDKVLLPKIGTSKVDYDRVEYLMIHEKLVLAKIEE